MTNIKFLLTGAPRLAKTTTAFRMAVAVTGFQTLIYVSRTINTFEKTIDTISSYVPALREVPITPLLSNINACPKAKEIYNNAGYDAVALYCKTCPIKLHKPRNVNTPVHLTLPEIKQFYDNDKICPSRLITARILYFNHNNTKQIIVMTYARLKHKLPDFINLHKISAIFDEARHIPDICILKQEPLNKERSRHPHRKIKDDYVAEIKALDLSMLSPDSQSKVDMARDIWCNNISTMKEFEGVFDVKDAQKELLGLLNKKVITINTPPPPPLTYKSLKNQIDFLNLLLTANGNNVALDDELTDSDTMNSVNLVIREMNGTNIESRANFKILSDASKFTFLVDSTPYPIEYYGFWLGENYDIQPLPLEFRYTFNIVIENVKRTLKYLKYKKNAKRFVDIINGVGASLKILIFSSSKNESYFLKKHNIECKHARGSEVEGVQSDKDYTLITRLPLQNINSEKYRDASIQAMTGGIGSHKEYIFIKAYAELLQMSFRTAKIGKTSGSFWMSIDESIIPPLKKYWPWISKDINFLVLKKSLRIADKIDYVMQGLMKGNLGLKRADRIISLNIVNYFTLNPAAKIEDCVNALNHRKDTVRRLIRHLQVTNQIKII